MKSATQLAMTDASELRVAPELIELVAKEIAPGTGIEAERFWAELGRLVADLGPLNAELLTKRDEFQTEINNWYRRVHRAGCDVTEPKVRISFQRSIGYLAEEPPDFQISTANVDAEIAEIAGPQLVVPVDNARYALNAANARWGSLFDALYGTDVITTEDGAERGSSYNRVRGDRVIARATEFLDASFPLAAASHAEVVAYAVVESHGQARLVAKLSSDVLDSLLNAEQFVGYNGAMDTPTAILLKNHGLHVELCIDRGHPVGQSHPAGVKDMLLESALTTIQDCEDSVAAVDAADKAVVYRNWLGLMKGDLTASFSKNGKTVERSLRPDREYVDLTGESLRLPGRSLMLVRNVGMHMYTDAVTTADGEPIPEGFLDIMMTALAAKHDLLGQGQYRNSPAGSIYVVKPKLHGPEEVAATIELFARVEKALDLPDKTIKIGIMDEERRTTINLKACIYEARDRIVFINTGFLDRTGDEIHTMMEAGPTIPKSEHKSATWLQAYEAWNVGIGLETGFSGRAQIGKGMWAMPNEMAAMLSTKTEHLFAGASTAWVPSPTAATLHALHYHQVDVAQVQQNLSKKSGARLVDVLTIPMIDGQWPNAEAIQNELDNNAQSILGYVVRWIQQGIGCSTVPDFENRGLMEDRATLRIASQHIANWLHHGLLEPQQVRESFARMAGLVDEQNENDPNYLPMSLDLEGSLAFQAALALVFEGLKQPNGYTEYLLHDWRRQYKQRYSG